MKSLRIISIIAVAIIINFFFYSSAHSQLFASPESGLFHNNSSTDLNLRAGTSFMTGFGGGSLFSHTVAPSVSQDISENFSVQAGTVFTSSSFSSDQKNAFFQGSGISNEHSLFQNNMYSNLSYAIGSYRVNKDLTLKGGAYFESSNFGRQLQMNPQAFNMDSKGMMMGFDYKINDNMRFGAEVNFRSGYSPYSNQLNPYSLHGFGQSPFNNRPLW